MAIADWTILVYMDGTALDPSVDLGHMQCATPSEDVNVVVHCIRSDTQQMKFVRRETVEICRSTDAGGSKKILQDFVTKGQALFPGRRVAVVLWGDGSGIQNRASRMPRWVQKMESGLKHLAEELGASRKRPRSPVIKDLIASLELEEVRCALQDSGVQIDLLGFDACRMSMVEVAYELRDLAHVMTASEWMEPNDPTLGGWPYTSILSDLAGDTAMSAQAFAVRIVTDYAAQYRDAAGDFTIASVPLKGKIEPVGDAFRRLTQRLITLLPERAEAIARARGAALKTYFDEFVDARDLLCKFIANDVAVEESQDAFRTLEAWIGKPFLEGPDVKRLSGISIFYPEHWTDGMDAIDKYKSLAFDKRVGWSQFLEAAVPEDPSSDSLWDGRP